MEDFSGRRLGPYELREVIGRGATATVYSAYQPSLNRVVAVKVLEDFGDQGLITRFRREAEAIARLQHRNILPIYDFGEEEGHFYFVVQYVHGGGTLGDLIGKIDQAHAITLVIRLLAGLAYAHARGIVHRDVKPSNVLLAEPDWPLLADFGVAKLLQAEAVNLTAVGLAVGTPAYMAPEQALNQAVDARADLYAVGVILYQLLTGVAPFDAETPHAVLLQHVDAPVRPPRQLNPAIAPELEAVVMRALEKDPNKRYADAESMSEALRALALRRTSAHSGVLGRAPATDRALPGPPVNEPSPPSRRGTGLRAVALSSVAALVMGLLGFLVFDRLRAAGASEIVLEPVAAQGVAPFTASVAVPRVQGRVEAIPVAAAAPDSGGAAPGAASGAAPGAAPGAAALDVQRQSGASPGLYGGTRDNGLCDIETLIGFLQGNAEKAGAWVAALNGDATLRWSGQGPIRIDQVPTYLRELSPVTLLHDTWVTNHGFVDGRPTPRRSVLQAGTAVLVDRYGVPRVRCACGNPLTRLQRAPGTPRYVGTPWAAFDPVVLTVVEPAPAQIDEFVVADPDTGEQQVREPGPKPLPCHDVDRDGNCDPPCPDEDGNGYCDQPCDDTDNNGTCDRPCPDADNSGYCDNKEPPEPAANPAALRVLPAPPGDTAPTAAVVPPGGDAVPAGDTAEPAGDATAAATAPAADCPDADGDGICDALVGLPPEVLPPGTPLAPEELPPEGLPPEGLPPEGLPPEGLPPGTPLETSPLETSPLETSPLETSPPETSTATAP